MKLLRIVLLFALLPHAVIKAQFVNNGQPRLDVKNLIPKSPQSEQLDRLNDIPVNLSRGVPDISFPLYTASIGSVPIPISISYDAGGIRYDDVPSSVGLKWTLIAGGEVSRSINGRADENFYFAHANQYVNSYFNSLNYATSTVQSLMGSIAENTYDISQDQYSYNFLNKSGQIYYRNNAFYDCANPKTYKVQAGSLTTLNNFTVTDDNGNNYYFGDNNSDYSWPTYGGSGYDAPNVPTSGLTAWKINKIHTYTNEEATFEWDTCSYTTYKVLSQNYAYKHATHPNQQPFYDCNCGNTTLNESNVLTNFLSFVIKAIHTTKEDVQFYYHNNTALNTYTKQLDSIVVTDKMQAVIKRVHFHYGTYSGANLLKLTDVWSVGSNNLDSVLIARFHYNSANLSGVTAYSRDIFNYNNGVGNTRLISTNRTEYTNYYSSADRNINATAIIIGNLDSIYYPTGGKAVFAFGANIVDSLYGPGVRVDSITYLNNDNSIAQKFQYSYLSPVHGYHPLTNYVNNYTQNNDNPSCPILSISSEVDLGYSQNPFYYNEVEVRKKGQVSSGNQLTKEIYTPLIDGYGTYKPAIAKKIFFRNNNLSDTLKIENYTYSYLGIDTAASEWLKPGNYYLPPEFYGLDGGVADNINACNVYYSGGVGAYGSIAPRTNLVVKQQTKDFDQLNSQGTLVSTVTSTYNSYWQKVSDCKINSRGNIDSAYYTYLYGNAGSLNSSVASANLYAEVNKTQHYLNASLLEQSRVNFSQQASGLILPDSFFIKKSGNNEFTDKTVTGYDAIGNPVEILNRDGLYYSVQRDYNNTVVTASVTNSKLRDMAATSFEADGKGGFNFAGTPASPAGTAPTGKKVYPLSGGNVGTNIDPSKKYTVSLWADNSSVTVNGASYSSTGRTIGSYTYYEYQLNNASAVSVSGTGTIDELRLYPQGAQMTTYTYSPLVGMTSQCDAVNHISYYEYDAQNRLVLVRDQDRNVIKKICYNYAGQPENCTIACTDFSANWQNTTTALRCQVDTTRQNTGYQEQEQKDINFCSATYNTLRWVTAGQNTSACPLPTYVNLTSTMTYAGTTGYTASYYNTTTGYTYVFAVSSASGLQTLGTVPAGNYTLTIARTTGGAISGTFKSGCYKQTITGTSATFYNVGVSTTTCNSITLTLGD